MTALRMTQAEVEAHRRKMAGWAPQAVELPPIVLKPRLPSVMSASGHLLVNLPLRLPNLANVRLGPFQRAREVKKQRNAIRNNIGQGMLPMLPAVVTLTRIGPRTLDTDGASASMKAVRDALAELYGVDDGSPLYTWRVEQEKSASGVFGVRIEIVRRESP